ncbi:hypothetical protein CR513_45957, partial [Mucuna pruriens]
MSGCSHYGNPKHIVDKCFKLHGYLDWWDNLNERKSHNCHNRKDEDKKDGKAAVMVSPPSMSPSITLTSTLVTIMSTGSNFDLQQNIQSSGATDHMTFDQSPLHTTSITHHTQDLNSKEIIRRGTKRRRLYYVDDICSDNGETYSKKMNWMVVLHDVVMTSKNPSSMGIGSAQELSTSIGSTPQCDAATSPSTNSLAPLSPIRSPSTSIVPTNNFAVADVLEETSMLGCQPIDTPIEQNYGLEELPNQVPTDKEDTKDWLFPVEPSMTLGKLGMSDI